MGILKYWKYLLYLIMTAYIIFIAASFYKINEHVLKNEQYSTTLSSNITALRIRCSELEHALPGIYSSPDMTYARVLKEIERHSQIIQKEFDRLSTSFPENNSTITQLRNSLQELKNLKIQAAEKLASNLSSELATTYIKNNIQPKLQKIEHLLDILGSDVNMNLNHMQDHIHDRMYLIIFVSMGWGVIIIIATIFYDAREESVQRALKYRESLFKQLTDTIDEVFIIASNASKFEFVSHNAKRILHISASQLQADPSLLYNALPPDDAAWLNRYLSTYDIDTLMERDTYIPSQNIHIKIRLYFLCISSIREERVTIVITDQTQAVQHQQALNDSLELAHSASAAKSTFLSQMSHEIRTPMNAIIGMTTIALAHLGEIARVKDCLRKISSSSRHLLNLLNNILDLSKIESGKFSINHEDFNLQEIIENIKTFILPQIQSKQQHLEIHIEDIEYENLKGDPMRLNQILLNILGNAIKFTPDHGKITLNLSQVEKNNNHIRILFRISDTGIGISQDFLSRIYNPFEQATPKTAARYGGSGLGLAITSNLITMMGGTIIINSQEGEGSTFLVSLPFELTASDAHSTASLPPLRILMISADQPTCVNTISTLSKMGQIADSAPTLKAAQEMLHSALLSKKPYDLCIIDYNPDDPEILEKIKDLRHVASSSKLTILASSYDPLTAKTAPGLIDGFISKPLFASTLHEALALIAQSCPEATQTPDSPPSSYNFEGKRVLLVEDNEFNREIGQEFLEMANAMVENAENGQEAVEKFEASPPGYYQLILMDVQMPIMNGYEATTTIRSSHHPDAHSIPIIAMTANAFTDDIAKALSSGMNHHLAKPIDIHALYHLLNTYLSPHNS